MNNKKKRNVERRTEKGGTLSKSSFITGRRVQCIHNGPERLTANGGVGVAFMQSVTQDVPRCKHLCVSLAPLINIYTFFYVIKCIYEIDENERFAGRYHALDARAGRDALFGGTFERPDVPTCPRRKWVGRALRDARSKRKSSNDNKKKARRRFDSRLIRLKSPLE